MSVYCLKCLCGCEQKYVGSTKSDLETRLNWHIIASKKGKSKLYKHIKNVNREMLFMELLKHYGDISRNELRAREDEWICKYGLPNLLNVKRERNGRVKCIHGNKRLERCFKCSPDSACQHRVDRGDCYLCDGKWCCEHKRPKRKCRICSKGLKIS